MTDDTHDLAAKVAQLFKAIEDEIRSGSIVEAAELAQEGQDTSAALQAQLAEAAAETDEEADEDDDSDEE